jgi:tetratricopeptide (TPR) repeat protein
MNRLIIRFYIIFIFLCGIFSTNAQVKEVSFTKADSLFEHGDFFEASIQYEMIFFYSQDLQNQALARYKRALCFKNTGDFQKAYEQLMPINPFGISEILFYDIKYELILNSYLSGELHITKANYLLVENYFKQDTLTNKLNYIYVLTLVGLSEFESAKQVLIDMAEGLENQEKKALVIYDINTLFKKRNLPKVKIENTAKYLSMFIPGSGQIYLGYVGEGLFSFTLNLTALTLGAYGIYQGYYLTGYIVGFGFLSKLHGGNQRRTAELANIKNHNEITDFKKDVVDILENIIYKN